MLGFDFEGQCPLYARKQPLALSGEWLLYPETSRSGARIWSIPSGCF